MQWHASSDVLWTADVENEGQLEHGPDPVPDLYLPVAHVSHAVKTPWYPASHSHAVAVVPLVLCAGHCAHASVPVEALYLPATQLTQFGCAEPHCPEGHEAGLHAAFPVSS